MNMETGTISTALVDIRRFNKRPHNNHLTNRPNSPHKYPDHARIRNAGYNENSKDLRTR